MANRIPVDNELYYEIAIREKTDLCQYHSGTDLCLFHPVRRAELASFASSVRGKYLVTVASIEERVEDYNKYKLPEGVLPRELLAKTIWKRYRKCFSFAAVGIERR